MGSYVVGPASSTQTLSTETFGISKAYESTFEWLLGRSLFNFSIRLWQSQSRRVFRTLSNTYGGTFLRK